jgi:hypothetical protein
MVLLVVIIHVSEQDSYEGLDHSKREQGLEPDSQLIIVVHILVVDSILQNTLIIFILH